MGFLLNSALSTLDKPTSLAPFFVKDMIDNCGRVGMAYQESGKHEARERFIEEFGTSLVWLGGIPFCKKMADKIIAPKYGIDPTIHYKRINAGRDLKKDGFFKSPSYKLAKETKQSYSNNQLFELTKEFLQKKGATESLEKLGKLSGEDLVKKYSKYHKWSTGLAVAASFVMLTTVLPRFNQGLSKLIIVGGAKKNGNSANGEPTQQQKNVIAQKPSLKSNAKAVLAGKTKQPTSNSAAFISKLHNSDNTAQNKKDVQFKGLGSYFNVKEAFNIVSMAENAQVNPVSSMLVLDYGIAGSRVGVNPRNNDERIEYAIKEGGIILFFYQAADWITKGLRSLSEKALKTPISLDYKILGDKEFTDKVHLIKNSTNSEKKAQEILKFADEANEDSILKFIDKNLENGIKTIKNTKGEEEHIFENFTLRMAQKSGLIDIEKKNGKLVRNLRKFIETENVAALNENLKTFVKEAINPGQTLNLENFIKKAKSVKAGAILGNMAICSITLCYFLPKFQYFIREKRTGTSAYPGIRGYEEEAQKIQKGHAAKA